MTCSTENHGTLYVLGSDQCFLRVAPFKINFLIIRFFSKKISSSFDIPKVESAMNKGDLSKNLVEWHLKSAYISIKMSNIRSGILYSIDL